MTQHHQPRRVRLEKPGKPREPARRLLARNPRVDDAQARQLGENTRIALGWSGTGAVGQAIAEAQDHVARHERSKLWGFATAHEQRDRPEPADATRAARGHSLSRLASARTRRCGPGRRATSLGYVLRQVDQRNPLVSSQLPDPLVEALLVGRVGPVGRRGDAAAEGRLGHQHRPDVEGARQSLAYGRHLVTRGAGMWADRAAA